MNSLIEKYFLKKTYFCPFCNKQTKFLDFGDPIRNKVYCTECGSLERHRFLFYIYKILFLDHKAKIKLLHMAPEGCIYNLLSNRENIEYFTADFQPEDYTFANCEKQDFTKMSYCNNSFDIILSNQVLEHINNEKECLNEIRRCLKDDGLAIINIPFNPKLDITYEDAKITGAMERKKRYGQSDHVRLYGNDVKKRFESAGFIVNQIEKNIFPEVFSEYCRFECKKELILDPAGYFILRKKIL